MTLLLLCCIINHRSKYKVKMSSAGKSTWRFILKISPDERSYMQMQVNLTERDSPVISKINEGPTKKLWGWLASNFVCGLWVPICSTHNRGFQNFSTQSANSEKISFLPVFQYYSYRVKLWGHPTKNSWGRAASNYYVGTLGTHRYYHKRGFCSRKKSCHFNPP